MGLTVCAKGAYSESFDIGYQRYARFLTKLVRYLKGVKEAREYQDSLVKDIFGNGTSLSDMLAAAMFARTCAVDMGSDAPGHPEWDEKYEAALRFFLNHSDCDGEFTHEQTVALSEMFTRYKMHEEDEAFVDNYIPKTGDLQFEQDYSHFEYYFDAAAKDPNGKIVYC